ncbi:GNAT family N-acetyltransferase [Maridesulfovibrio sp.]|uniref:GNAT family N-acetyltransferase n=1 Tax=Maridesulfovibrio sp. TaxID=2795000 RepID=UPI002AA921C1|nr:GNAT family N-acetyltransferase [Maridesulfovibrio sp.]
MLKIVAVSPNKVPMHLLLEADPSEDSIKRYLDTSLCYLALKSDVPVGVCVLGRTDEATLELYNIAVCPSVQNQGVGTKLLSHAIEEARAKGFERIELGTGTFGYQLAFYQRAGFRVEAVIKNHFVDNYAEPIFELGIQLKDMLRLTLQL